MGAWADKAVSVSLVRGFAEQLLADYQDGGAVDASQVTSERTAAAKALVRRKLLDRKVGHLAGFVDRYASVEAMMDAIAGSESLEDQLDEVLALAFVRILAPQASNRLPDVMATEAELADEQLDAAIRALAEVAPFALSHVKQSGSPGGAFLASGFSTYGN